MHSGIYTTSSGVLRAGHKDVETERNEVCYRTIYRLFHHSLGPMDDQGILEEDKNVEKFGEIDIK